MWGFCQKLKSQFPATIKLMAKRSIFDELMEGVSAMKAHREGKVTLRTYKVESARVGKVDPKLP